MSMNNIIFNFRRKLVFGLSTQIKAGTEENSQAKHALIAKVIMHKKGNGNKDVLHKTLHSSPTSKKTSKWLEYIKCMVALIFNKCAEIEITVPASSRRRMCLMATLHSSRSCLLKQHLSLCDCHMLEHSKAGSDAVMLSKPV